MYMRKVRIILLLVVAVVVMACQQTAKQTASPFVTVEDGHFVKDGKPYYYVGTNFWYGAILASEGQVVTVSDLRGSWI